MFQASGYLLAIDRREGISKRTNEPYTMVTLAVAIDGEAVRLDADDDVVDQLNGARELVELGQPVAVRVTVRARQDRYAYRLRCVAIAEA